MILREESLANLLQKYFQVQGMKSTKPCEFLTVEYLVKFELSGVARWSNLFMINNKHRNTKQKTKRNTGHILEIEKFIPGNDAKKCCCLYTHLM